MRISELARRADVPLPTVKYYLREGLLMPGVATGPTRASYDEQHLRRLGLIRALADHGIPLDRIKTIVALADAPDDDLFEVLGRAVAALPPYVGDAAESGHPRAHRLLARLGRPYDPRCAAVAQLDHALAALDAAGLTMSDRRLDLYDRHVRAVAEYEIAAMPTSSRRAAVEGAVLGTALYEPVLAALRRLAHQQLVGRILAADTPGSPTAIDSTNTSQESP